jgi:hypothetical protein
MWGLKLYFTRCFVSVCNTKEIMKIDDVSEKGTENKSVNQKEKANFMMKTSVVLHVT